MISPLPGQLLLPGITLKCSFLALESPWRVCVGGRIGAVFVSCVLCLRSAFCVMLGARTMLGAMENMEFINI